MRQYARNLYTALPFIMLFTFLFALLEVANASHVQPLGRHDDGQQTRNRHQTVMREGYAKIAARPKGLYHAFVSIPISTIHSISRVFPLSRTSLPQQYLRKRLFYIRTRLSSFSCVCEHFRENRSLKSPILEGIDRD